jgi:hypothetical protein
VEQEEEKLFGPFIALNQIFEDHTDLGWTGDWPHRFQFKLWDGYI